MIECYVFGNENYYTRLELPAVPDIGHTFCLQVDKTPIYFKVGAVYWVLNVNEKEKHTYSHVELHCSTALNQTELSYL